MCKINSILVLTIVMALWGCSRNQPDVLTIGAILPLTGDGAKYGEEAKRGIELATLFFNTKNAGHRIVVIYEDDQGSAKNAITAFNKLATFDKVPIVIGPMYSSTALAVAPIAEKYKIVLFSPSASIPSYTNAGDYIFRNWPSDVYEGAVMARFAHNKLNFNKIGVLTVNLDYGIGLSKVFSNTFTKLGGHISVQEQYIPGTTNFRAQLLNLKAAHLDAIYLPGYYNDIALSLKQACELGIQSTFLSCVGFDNSESVEIAGEAANGVIFARPAYDPNSDDSATSLFVHRFTSEYGVKPGTYAAHAYDAANIVFAAFLAGARTPPDIKNSLYNIKGFPGATGTTSIDKNGDVIKPIQIMEVDDGRFVKLSID